jgi:tRNA pseudouridine13 synthase
LGAMISMEYELNKDSFFVHELYKPQLTNDGKYAYYTVEKRGLSHKQLQKRLPKDTCFCGVKDRNATTTQWFSTENPIDEIDEKELKVKLVGFSEKRIFIGAHKGNSFKVLVKLNDNEEKKLKYFSEKKEFICNYFGEQRIGTKSKTLFEAFDEKDYEKALKLFLTEKSKFDTQRSTKMKEIIFKNWGNWKEIRENELIKGTGKEVLFSYLENNPDKFMDAFEHAEMKSLKQTIKTMQAIRWNSALKEEALLKRPKNIFDENKLPLEASKAFKREITIEPSEFEKKFIGRRLTRETFFNAKNFHIKKEKNKSWLLFELGKGAYATIFLKYLKEWLKKQ